MKIKKSQWIGIGIGVAILIISLFFISSKAFFFMVGMAVLAGSLPFVFAVVHEAKIASEKEEMFLEFARNLVESVKTGTPISKSIINMRNKPYGVLSENVKKLANQIHLGIPLSHALRVFANDTNNKTISRTLTLIGQAERAGGKIGEILESVTEAVSVSDKLKKERKAAIYTLAVQGYIIFFVFIVIVLVMQYIIVPMIGGIGDFGQVQGVGVGGVALGGGGGIAGEGELSNAFLYLLLIQGLFTGLTIGKLSEGTIKAGVKHSFALMITSFLISTGANIIWGG